MERTGQFRVASMDSIAPCEVATDRHCTGSGTEGTKFIVFTAAPWHKFDALWTTILAINKEFLINHIGKVSAKDLTESLHNFMSDCCVHATLFLTYS